MRKCNKCDVSFNGNLNRCPLCQSELIGEKTESVFPKVKSKNAKLIQKILVFVSLIIVISFTYGEAMISKDLYISKYVFFGLITNYILVTFILNNYSNVLKMLNKYFLVLLILLFLWYFITKSLLITSFIIPVLCIIIFVFNSIIMIVLRHKYFIKFTKTILIDCIVGLIPILLVIAGLSVYPLLSHICLILDIITFLFLIIFCREDVIEEFRKIFNI